MIINAIVGVNSAIYSGGWDGFVKKVVGLESEPSVVDQVNLNSCINTICIGVNENTVYAGCTDGTIKKLVFS